MTKDGLRDDGSFGHLTSVILVRFKGRHRWFEVGSERGSEGRECGQEMDGRVKPRGKTTFMSNFASIGPRFGRQRCWTGWDSRVLSLWGELERSINEDGQSESYEFGPMKIPKTSNARKIQYAS